jgi:hypothetical protein
LENNIKVYDEIIKNEKVEEKAKDKSLVLIRGLDNITIDDDSVTKLDKFSVLFENSKTSIDLDIIDDREQIYDGTHTLDTDRNIINLNVISKESNQPYRLAYELIEAQVSDTVPQPVVDAKEEEFELQARIVEHALRNDLVDSGINKVTDKNERVTMKHGFSIVEVAWNPNKKSKNYKGDIQLVPIHPKSFIYQSGVWNFSELDYYFIALSTTKQYVYQRFKIDVSNETEEYPELNYVNSQTTTIDQFEKVTLICAYYKDSDGDIGKFTWINNTILEDMPKYYYRRPNTCVKCGNIDSDVEKKCTVCGGKLKHTIQEYETIYDDLELEQTRKQFNPQTGLFENVKMIIPAGTRIKYYVPQEFPHIDRINVPNDFGFGGVSDIDAIRDKYMAMSKLMNNVCEIAQNPVLITKLRNMKIEITDLIYQVVNCDSIADVQALQVLDLKGDIISRLELIKNIYRQAKDTLGITDSFQGKYDPSAKSGKAKEIAVNQSSGRLNSKRTNKDDFFKRLFERMFQFKLAYYDEKRSYVVKDAMGQNTYYKFNKYDFLTQDEFGDYYYYDEFIFNVDNGGGWERDRQTQYNQTMQLWQIGAFNPSKPAIMLWSILEKLNYPNAGMIRQDMTIEVQKQEQQQQAQMQQQMQQTQQQAPQEQQQQEQQNRDPLSEALNELSVEDLQHLKENPNIIQQILGGQQGG